MVYLNCRCTGIMSVVFPRDIANRSHSKCKRQAIKARLCEKVKTEYLLLAQIDHYKEITKIVGFES